VNIPGGWAARLERAALGYCGGMRTALAAGLAFLALAAPAAAQTPDTTPTIAADGVGVAALAPDIAQFAAAVSETAATSSKARRAANRISSAIRSAALAAGVAATDLRTVGVSVRRERQRKRKNRPARTVFNASQAIAIKVRDLSKLGPLMDAAAEAGAQGVEGPEFDFSDPSAGRLLATRAALGDARKRADDAAAQVGLRITGVRSVVLAPDDDEYETSSGDSVQTVSAGGGEESGRPTTVDPGTRDFVERVRVVFTAAPV
jgi:uncharacterized protein YggE